MFSTSFKRSTVNPQKRPAGLILSLRVQMRVLLEFCRIFAFLPNDFYAYCGFLLECGSYSRAGLFRGFTVVRIDSKRIRGKFESKLIKGRLLFEEIE